MVRKLAELKVSILKKNMKSSLIIRISAYFCLIFISCFMLYSGFKKVIDIYQFINTLGYYYRIPTQFHILIGYSIPIFEVLIGALIWVKSLRNIILFFYEALIIIFIVILVLHYGAYMPYGCGCFGKSKAETINYLLILRDFSFFIPSLLYRILNFKRL
ncbi:MauE/DoxX family redox-associated membrane protein [Priestia aryabhattai]|uniref:MauE/DoxX family redox-associated membrane protein n=1 Tax=Priestia aryabhattai TaxID=412384 RepID=UPI003CC7ACDA